ncbi:nucleotidyltransferase domain-containing protein [Lederbergia galactosidilytica]|uniref:DNA polymerase III subunit beta n=1 Tax=Lederbergia galactosidilytica TaxID=217031 RepID=A0A177ZTP5_9BACI|nr:nucleotidyltransferase domain-containing protein [Lederbergia galactosidilytica]KRG13717.1 DNA polymerase III subunit beta [Virgibacillus soli]OAK70710.1 DNA polymerase III subunit beta [Lederbergia galactosidilytica]
MKQEDAVQTISQSLKKDKRVKAIFLKGSMGRGEYDEYSDVDLYCLVDEKEKEAFLNQRLSHLESYRNILFYEDYFIIAPQIIAVFDNLLHVDLYTVTEKTFDKKDFFHVLYDPENRLAKFQATQNLMLSSEEFADCAYDVAWFLFQYHKANQRGNDLWAVEMLRHVIVNLAKVLLHRYRPERAQLGLKTLKSSLPLVLLNKVKLIFQYNTPGSHSQSVNHLMNLLDDEIDWIECTVEGNRQAGAFLRMMIKLLN